MTKREALRQTEQENILRSLGFTQDEAEQLRRISMTLHRWHEWECGMNDACIVRGKRNGHGFEYDENGAPYLERAGVSGPNRYCRIQDDEKGAKRRLDAIIKARNGRNFYDVSAYIQGDPRGAALYILRPGDVPEGKTAESYYTRGICVY